MIVALDTNAYSALIETHKLDVILSQATEVIMPFPVVGELLAGFRIGAREAANRKVLDEFLQEPLVTVAHSTDHTVDVYGTLFAQLRRQGTPIPTNDIWIAAVCLETGATLVTADSDFRHIVQLATWPI
jgi:tRNA(fMet)-specific endonuclease VapC